MSGQSRFKRNIVIALAVLVTAGAVGGYLTYRHRKLPQVQVELIARRDLEAVVSASGQIEPKRAVNISADTIGRVTRLAVEEGDRVERGQFLLQIDPEVLASAVERNEAGLAAAREAIENAKVAVESARASLDLANQNYARSKRLHEEALVPRESLDRAESELAIRKAELKARETEVRAQEQRLEQQVAELRSARHNLAKVTIDAPIDGIVTRLNIEEGETVLVGTMNNPGTVLMTVSDLSVIQARLEVDETEVNDVALGQAATIEIDAFPDRLLTGVVTKIGSSAIEANALMGNQRQATMFEVEVTLEGEVPDARPGFSCTADITTATRIDVLAVPIQALTVRAAEMDDEGNIRPIPRKEAVQHQRLSEEEIEGVFVVRDGIVVFTPVEIGIAGEQHFEVLSGLREGDEVVVGPFNQVRDLEHGDRVRLASDDAP